MGEGKTRSTRREHLEAAAAQGDPEAAHELASLPTLPRHAAHLWDAFLNLHGTRSSAGMGPSRLSRLEIHAWEQDEAQVLEPWERRALMAVDAAWLRIFNEHQAKEANK